MSKKAGFWLKLLVLLYFGKLFGQFLKEIHDRLLGIMGSIVMKS
jgi:hypothetical protein